MNIENFGLGRTVKSDPKAFAKYPLRSALPKKESKRQYRYWNHSYWQGDQGDTSQCVAYSWLHFIHAGPVTLSKVLPPVIAPEYLYNQCQLIDEWEGENYDGTSVNAGAKVLKSLGYIKEYRWTTSVDELAQAVLEVGPAVLGTNWPYGFFFPNKDYVLEMKGRNAGGHAYLCIGVNMKKKLFKIKNSWGKSWGNNGCAFIRFEDMQVLLDDWGECALPIEVKMP